MIFVILHSIIYTTILEGGTQLQCQASISAPGEPCNCRGDTCAKSCSKASNEGSSQVSWLCRWSSAPLQLHLRLQVARLVGSIKESLCGSWLYCKPERNLLLPDRITLCHPLFPRRPSVPSPGEGYIHLQLPRCGRCGSSQDSHSRLVECWEFSVSGGQSPRAGPKPCRTARRMKECLQIT